MFVGVARITLQIPDSGSLKAKRQILRRVTDRVKARFNASVAEVDDNELWQRATIALAVVGNDQRHVSEQLEKIIHFVDDLYVAPMVSRELEIIPLGDRLFTRQNQGAVRPGEGSGGRGGHGGRDEGARAGQHEGEAPRKDSLELDIAALMAPGDRSLAEAEGMGEWEHRHDREDDGDEVTEPSGRSEGAKSKDLSLEDARARARALRNPRDWEKP